MRGAGERGDVPHIFVLGGDVEIAADRHGQLRAARCCEVPPQARQPCQFVGVVLGADAAAVRDIDAGDLHPPTNCGDQPRIRVRVGTVRKTHDGAADAQPGKDGNPVPLARAMVHGLITEGGEGHVGEGRVGQLGLLQAEHVGPRVGEPFGDALHAHLEGIDVPGGDPHLERQAEPEGGITTTWNSSARRPSGNPTKLAP